MLKLPLICEAICLDDDINPFWFIVIPDASPAATPLNTTLLNEPVDVADPLRFEPPAKLIPLVKLPLSLVANCAEPEKWPSSFTLVVCEASPLYELA